MKDALDGPRVPYTSLGGSVSNTIFKPAALAVAALALGAAPASAQWTAVSAPNNGGGAFWDNLSTDGTYCNIGYVLSGVAQSTDCTANNQRPANWLPYMGAAPTHFLGGTNSIGFMFAAGSYRIDQLGSTSLGGDISYYNNLWGTFTASGGDVSVIGSNSGSGDLSLTFYSDEAWGFWIDLSSPAAERAYSNAAGTGGFYHSALFAYDDAAGWDGSTVSLAYGASAIVGLENNGCLEVDLQVGCSQASDRDYQDAIFTVTAVPEPSTYLLVAGGLLGMGIAARRRRAA